jgi:outer membrane cobalamin receptor
VLISTIASASFYFLCMTPGGAGEVSIDTVGPYYLDEIVVTATRYTIALQDLSATVSVVTEKDIEALNTHNSTDVLGLFPGVFIHKTGTFGRADVDIRGLGDRGRSVMVLIDGRPVKMGLYGCTITHSLPMDNVERIEVVRGPASVLYGSDALGGVINIITKKPREKYEGDIIVSYGNCNTQQYRLRTGGYLDKVYFYVTGDYRLSDGYVDNSAYDGKNFTGKFGYRIHESLDAVITGTYFDGYKEEPLRTTDPDSISSDVWNDYKRWAVDFTTTGTWHTIGIMAKVYRNHGEHRFSDGWHSKDYTNGCMIQGSAGLVTGNTLSIGGDFRQQGGRKIATEVQPDTGKWQKNEYGIFVHDEQLLFDRLIVTFGARYNRDEVAGDDISPQIGCVLHLTDGTIIRGLVSKGFRSPQINELYLFPSSNTDLAPEIVWNYEVGLNQRIIQGLNFEATAFLMRGENLIELGQNAEPPPLYVFKNTGTFEFRGMEVGVIGTLNNIVSARVYHSYLGPQEKTTGKPQHKTDVTVLLSYAALGFALNGQYITDYYAADSSHEAIPDYAIVNTKVTYQLPFGLQPFCAIDNIFDEDYDIYANLPGGSAGLYKMPGRIFTIGAQYKF